MKSTISFKKTAANETFLDMGVCTTAEFRFSQVDLELKMVNKEIEKQRESYFVHRCIVVVVVDVVEAPNKQNPYPQFDNINSKWIFEFVLSVHVQQLCCKTSFKTKNRQITK